MENQDNQPQDQNPDMEQQPQNENENQQGNENPEEGEEVEVVEVVEELVEDEEAKKGKKKKKRKWRRVKKKRRRRSFDLNGIIHLNPLGYDALKDDHLKGFFYSSRIRTHLQKMNLITRDGYIIENPNEYWNHKRIVREHYKSSSPGRRVKKYKKISKKKKGRVNKDEVEPIEKEQFQDFMQDIQNKINSGDGDGQQQANPQADQGNDDF